MSYVINPTMLYAVMTYKWEEGGTFWLDVHVDGSLYESIPFDTEDERDAAIADFNSMAQSIGSGEGTFQ